MVFTRTTAVLLAACTILAIAIAGCARNPGEAYEDSTIEGVIAGQPGLYEIYSGAQNPIEIVTSGENWVVLRQGKNMIIAGGDTLQDRLTQFRGQDFSIAGRRMGQPKLWFAVDHIIQEEKSVLKVGQGARKEFPSYQEYSEETVADFAVIDLNEFDYDKERAIRRDLLDKKVRITGNLIAREEEGVKRWFVESRNLFVELQPIGNNIRYFLEMSQVTGAPFVAYGELTGTLPWEDGTETDRGSSKIIGPFRVDWLRYGSDIIVQNII
jgi:hypothetical protein